MKEIHVPKAYVDSVTPQDACAGSAVDYALVTVSEDLSSYTHFELGVPSTDYINDMEEVKIFSSGFSSETSLDYVCTLVGHECDGINSNEQQLYYTNMIYAGMSGGPVYTVTDVYENGNFRERINTVLAINSAAHISRENWEFLYSSGPAINSFMLAFYGANPNIGY